MIHVDAASLAAIAAAGLVAAAVNALAGGGTLLSFPVLLALGYPALVANVSNTIGLLPGYLGGTVSYRRELSGQARSVRLLGGAGAIGGVGGAYLLSRTSEPVFRAAVPLLILASCALLAVQPLVVRRLAAGHGAAGPSHPVLLTVLSGVAGIYGAFFGAGLGVLFLALLGLFLADSLQRLNALKGMLSLVVNAVAAVLFAVLAPVSWPVVAAMAPAAFAGGFVGAGLARRLSPTLLRSLVIVVGVAVAVRLMI